VVLRLVGPCVSPGGGGEKRVMMSASRFAGASPGKLVEEH
jgi:hypothetical protein